MALSAIPSCALCTVKNGTAKLLVCQACKVVHYCGRDHQLAHRRYHKEECNAIKKSRQVLDREETKLRSNPGDLFTPPNLFEEQVGHFWGIFETRSYMRARYAHMEALIKVETYAAVEAAHGHLMDILRLCRSDNMGVRDMVPAVKLRLGRDQECYDFCKWWATTGNESKYDWGDMSNPYLDVKNADVFELPDQYFIREFGSLSHAVAITLLKIRLLTDLHELQNSSVIGDKVPQEVLDGVRSQLVSHSAVAGNKNVMDSRDQTPLIESLELQVEDLYDCVDGLNEYFWPALLDPDEHLTARPEAYSSGTIEEMQLLLQQNFMAWFETPGAIDKIKEMIESW